VTKLASVALAKKYSRKPNSPSNPVFGAMVAYKPGSPNSRQISPRKTSRCAVGKRGWASEGAA
jgi:hypothetical protein